MRQLGGPMYVFLFPGQSSRHPAMLRWIADRDPALFDEVAEVTSQEIDWRPPKDTDLEFPTNHAVQISVFVANHLHMRMLQRSGLDTPHSAGLSLGEYNHLVHIGALNFADGLRLVSARGHAYDAGPQGLMAAVFPIGEDELADVLAPIQSRHDVAISNYNSPTQYVIAGTDAGVTEAIAAVEADTYAEARIIERHVPMHCSVFEPVAAALRPHLEQTRFTAPRAAYVPNVTAEPIADPSATQVVQLLTRHVYQPVRFRQTVDYFMSAHPDAAFVEVGPRRVIANMLGKRWCRHPVWPTDDDDALDDLLAATA